jgi:hypothetical protein
MATTGRNEPCPCGSGLRFKACHGRMTQFVRKADFVVGGVQKGGSSALAAYLARHPQVCLSKVKETHWFNKDENFPPGAVDYAPYHAYFEPNAGHKVLGDATPTYIYWPQAPVRLAQYNPALKFIILLRNPAERAYSHWNMLTKERRETLPFEEAIRTEAERCRGAKPGDNAPSYVDRGFYARQLERTWQHFPREQTLVLRSGALQMQPEQTLATIAQFLGVTPFPITHRIEVFKLPYEQPMSSTARAFLRDTFAEDIARLEQLLGWDLSEWRK